MKKISIIIPIYNEHESIPKLYEALLGLINELPHYSWEVLLVNDGSSDSSLMMMRRIHTEDARFRVINLSRNFGKENAMLAGLDNATGDATIIMDADLQHPVSVIPQMLDYWEEGYDDIYGLRTNRNSDSWVRKQLSLGYYSLLRKMANIDMIPNAGDFRLLDRKCVDALCSMRETQRYSKGLFSWIGFNKKQVEYDLPNRQNGKSSFSYKSLINLALEGITGFSTAPLRIVSLIGLLTALIALVYMIYVFVKTLIYGDPVDGYPTLMCVMLILGGAQLLALGIIGEYIARIFNETKHRPPYIIESIDK